MTAAAMAAESIYIYMFGFMCKVAFFLPKATPFITLQKKKQKTNKQQDTSTDSFFCPLSVYTHVLHGRVRTL